MSERLFNAVFYALRQRLRWSRPTYCPRNEDKAPFFRAKPHLLSVAGRLEARYHLRDFRGRSTSIEYRESLYVLELMERFFPAHRLRDPVRALDVGSKNFAYARGLHHFFRHGAVGCREAECDGQEHLDGWLMGATGREATAPRQVELTGIEVDPYQVYTDLHSRHDYALYHTRNLDGCRYLTGDVMEHQGRYDAVTWFLPFVTEYAHRKWGLPGSLFRPEPLLRHVFGLLAPGGVLILSSREEEERDIQAQLLGALGIPFRPPERHESDWMAYTPRYVFVIEKPLLTAEIAENAES